MFDYDHTYDRYSLEKLQELRENTKDEDDLTNIQGAIDRKFFGTGGKAQRKKKKKQKYQNPDDMWW